MEGNSLTSEEIQNAIRVLNLATTIDLKLVTNLSAFDSLVSAAQKLMTREKSAKDRCLIRANRIQRAHKVNGRVGGVLPVVTLSQGEGSEESLLLKSRRCYICKEKFRKLHFFYDHLCQDCGGFNYTKRLQTTELDGFNALVTGGRIKIGFEIVLKLLRAGARVTATTRFPDDAIKRYKAVDDWKLWNKRLTIRQLDLLDIQKVIEFCRAVADDPLHILINNAAQTIARPSGFYHDLIQPETKALVPSLTFGDTWNDHVFFPKDALDENGIQVDYRPHNTWIMKLEETPFAELLQVTVVNYIAPYVMLRELHSALSRAKPRSFVVNVSAMEGNYLCHKTGFHAHTNAAKAAMNMLTRTIGRVWADQGIYVTSVDTGWITNEYPIKRDDSDDKFHPPLDEVDGAARVLDPIFAAGEKPSFGVFLKDYKPRSW